MNPDSDLLYTILRDRFGFGAFRPGQLHALEQLFSTGRLLCIQPTGRGKSLLYQLPACILPGIVLVISPLLALMRDQVEQLTRRFGIPAASLNSDQTEEENFLVRETAMTGKIRLLFVSPEQLDHIDRFTFLLSLKLSLIVIDEAHCISTWGHDFRPGYRQIFHFVKAAEEGRPDLRVLGLTATASERVEQDIQEQLFSSDRPGLVLREEMDRPNLHLSVHAADGIASKLFLTEALLQRHRSLEKGAVLLYCATREHTELVAEFLQKRGVRAVAYHAGMESEEKRRIQQAFMRDEYDAIAATNALGMGIDKPNIRLVLHFDIPGSITAYYQEVGRAGRDGLDACGVLIYDPRDREVQEHFIHSAVPTVNDFDQVRHLCETQPQTGGWNLTAIKQATGLHPTRVNVVIAELLEQGFLVKQSIRGKQVYCSMGRSGQPDLSSYEVQREAKLRELGAILQYAAAPPGCRMELLRRALGDAKKASCGRCDICRPGSVVAPDLKVVGWVNDWLAEKPLPIPSFRASGLSDGISLLDGRLRSPLFIRFMKTRQEAEEIDLEILRLLKMHLKNGSFGAVVPLPSRSWKAREAMAKAISEWVQAPLFADLLVWKTPPSQRQGFLLNNDQRKLNVHGMMEAVSAVPNGPLLLLDDYIGSGATLREAARALRIQGGRSLELIPLTIATVKWHLGKSGFI